MVIKLLLFLFCLTAHVWLWGEWNLQRPVGESLLLVVDSLLLLLLLGLPTFVFFKGREVTALLKKKSYFSIFILYVALTILLSVLSFRGVIQFLLPVIVLIAAVIVFLKFRPSQSVS